MYMSKSKFSLWRHEAERDMYSTRKRNIEFTSEVPGYKNKSTFKSVLSKSFRLSHSHHQTNPTRQIYPSLTFVPLHSAAGHHHPPLFFYLRQTDNGQRNSNRAAMILCHSIKKLFKTESRIAAF